jgi:TPR repeat protein
MFGLFKKKSQLSTDVSTNPGKDYDLGFRYAEGLGCEQDFFKAVVHLTRAANAGDAGAQFNLGRMFMDGTGVEQSNREAMRYFRLAAKNEDTPAQFFLGLVLCSGDLGTRDTSTGQAWIMKAAENGLLPAQVYMAGLFEKGGLDTPEAQRGLKWRLLAAEQGDVESQRIAGIIYLNKGDADQTVRWLSTATENGDGFAGWMLANCYLRGEPEALKTLPDRRATGYSWLEKSANLGYTGSYCLLAACHADNALPHSSRGLALEWCEKALAAGDTDANSLYDSLIAAPEA